jgi:hypothetical protein
MLGAAELYLRLGGIPPTQPGIRHYLTHRHLIQHHRAQSEKRPRPESS